MMVYKPKGRVLFGSVGLGDASWVGPWLSAGYNDADMGGQILAFMAAQPNQPTGNDPVSVSQRTGRWVPWSGNAGCQASLERMPTYPYLQFAMPTDSVENGPSGLLDLGDPPPANFISPGDDAMRWAITNWVGINAPAVCGGGGVPFSQAVGSSGVTAAQAATIAQLSQPGAAGSPGLVASPGVAVNASAGSTGEHADGQSASPGGAAPAFGLRSIPWWVWAIGGGLVLLFAMGGNDG